MNSSQGGGSKDTWVLADLGDTPEPAPTTVLGIVDSMHAPAPVGEPPTDPGVPRQQQQQQQQQGDDGSAGDGSAAC